MSADHGTATLRILYILPYVPSPIRVRPYQFIRQLARAGHHVTVAALGEGSPADSAALVELRSLCEAVHIVPHPRRQAMGQALAALPTPIPLWAAWCRSPEMLRLLRSLAANGAFDVAHIEHLRAAQYADSLGDLPCVFDAVDCITELRSQLMTLPTASRASRLLSRQEWRKIRRYEPQVCGRFPQIVVTSRIDAEALTALGVDRPISVLPNGVDGDTFHPIPGTPCRWSLVFTGKMSYAPNRDAALYLLEEILPRLDALMPAGAAALTVCLAGSGPDQRLRQAAARWGDRVTVTGYVDDLQTYLASAQIAICPMRAGVGIQNKALEAMATGLPVVATPIVGRALESAVAAGAVRIAPDADSLARACADWLQTPDAARHAGAAGRACVENDFRWDSAGSALVKIYTAVFGRRSTAGMN